ncbi:hypothetical protein DPMN_086264 [Dreissena polymorpha]|uniref:Tyrosine specific protein phosphatases domain-containing protein n=1 Tax=Dreissena polymorpha TaxID=45954 RepID=A0A9D3YI03_DREPO|nr:hypothetical protein DPMN_086264 [Dreissena polymorpha]
MGLKEQCQNLSTEESLFPDDNSYKSATTNENHEAPILIQCLNGADKSGLFMVIWTLLEHVEIDGEVSMPRVVRHFRLRRKQIIPIFVV